MREYLHVHYLPLTNILECLKSLNDPVARFRVQEVDPVRLYNKNTFDWLFTDQVPFSRWLRDDSGEFDAVFWITGKPGSGKSTLMRFALEDSRTMSLQPPDSKGDPMAYFFHLRGKSLVQKSLRGMLMELMYQVLDRYPRFFELIRPFFLDVKRMKQDWDVGRLTQAILRIPYLKPAVKGYRDRITLFIDALDENENRDDNTTLLGIFDDLVATYRGVRDKPNAPVLKICLASRPWPIFRKRLENDPRVPSFAIHDFTLRDIQQYTTTHIVKAFGERQRAISQITKDITSRAKGVFIWVRVVVHNLRQEIIDGTPIDSLQSILHRYPMELDEMYELTLKRIAPEYLKESLILFRIMLAVRVPFTALEVYTTTCICQGISTPDDGPTESLDDITSWLESRSGGLIDTVDTGTHEECSVVSDNDSRIKVPQSGSNFPARPNTRVEFIHQTVPDFLRKSLDDTIVMEQPEPSVDNMSGSRLLTSACLRRHPPHPWLLNVAKDIFAYMREVEREEDETQRPSRKSSCSYNTFDFPFFISDSGNFLGKAQTTTETFSHYLDPHNPLIRMALGKDNNLYDRETSNVISPVLLSILHNLYHTKSNENHFIVRPKYALTVCNLLLFIASVGPRLSHHRVDRPRMFQHILVTFVAPLLIRLPTKRIYTPPIRWLSYKPIFEFIDGLSIPQLPTNLIHLFACLKPSTEVDDNTLLAFAEVLLRYPSLYSWEPIVVEIPVTSTHGPDKQESACQTVRMTPVGFCSRFRETNLAKWVDLFRRLGRGQKALGMDGESQHFLDLAVYDAVNQEPPQHAYTRLVSLVEWEAERWDPIIGQVIASACIPAAVVGLGSSQIFRAFYEVDHGNFEPYGHRLRESLG